jgi:FkbM family methyltransferase
VAGKFVTRPQVGRSRGAPGWPVRYGAVALRDWTGRSVEALARAARPLVPSASLRRVLGRVRRTLPRPRPDDPIGEVIFEFGRAYPEAVFLQIGANDGRQMDPLHEEIRARRWRGVLVEPVPYIFERLQSTHGSNPRLILENVAIAPDAGTRTLYHLAKAEPGAPVPEWYDKLGSFDRDVVLKHRPAIPDFDRRLATLEVPCVTIDELCRKHGLTALDLVQMDTEGFDYEIVKLLDLDRLAPRLLMYEHLHFDDATRVACSDHVRRHGYEELSTPVDTLCLRTVDLTPRDAALHECWTRLRRDF